MGAAGRERVLRASSWQAVAEQFDAAVAKSLESDR
jgi:hypothetical protein